MATTILTSTSVSYLKIRLTYTAKDGVVEITEMEGMSADGRSYDASAKSVIVGIDGSGGSVSLNNYVDFNTSYTAWGVSHTRTGVSSGAPSITVKMPKSESTFGGVTFSGKIKMEWSKYTVSYDANGGTGAPVSQTKYYPQNLKLSNIKPVRTGYKFVQWVSETDDGTFYYQPSDTVTYNGDQTLVAEWSEITGTKNKTITVETLGTLHDYNKMTYVAKDDIVPVENGGTGSHNGSIGLKNLLADGHMILSSYQYGDELPTAGFAGRIFFKKLVD